MDDRFTSRPNQVPDAQRTFTLALLVNVTEVLDRHGNPCPTGYALVELCEGLYRACHGPGTWNSG